MKVDKVTYTRIVSNLETIIDYFGKSDILVMFEDDNVNTAFMLWHKLFCCKTYDTENPNVLKAEDGSRYFLLDDTWTLYPCNTNDDTIKTAIVKAVKEVLQDVVITENFNTAKAKADVYANRHGEIAQYTVLTKQSIRKAITYTLTEAINTCNTMPVGAFVMIQNRIRANDTTIYTKRQ